MRSVIASMLLGLGLGIIVVAIMLFQRMPFHPSNWIWLAGALFPGIGLLLVAGAIANKEIG